MSDDKAKIPVGVAKAMGLAFFFMFMAMTGAIWWIVRLVEMMI